MAQITRERPAIDEVRSRSTATAWLAGGTLWLAAGLLHADGGWRFDAAAVAWVGADVLVTVGLLGLFVLRPHGTSRAGTAALAVAVAGRVTFIAGELVSLLEGNDEGPLIPLAALTTAMSMTLYGIVVLRRDRITGPVKWSFLVMGLYPFVAMFPAFAITGEPSTLLIAGWGIPTALVGLAVLPQHRSAARTLSSTR